MRVVREPVLWCQDAGIASGARGHAGRQMRAALAAFARALRPGPDCAAFAARAAAAAGRAVALDPRCWAAYELAAAAHSLRMENGLALVLVRRAAALGPGRAWPFFTLARLSWKADLKGALSLLDEADAAEPGHPFTACFRGELMRRAGRARAGLRSLDRGLAQRPFARAWAWRARARADLGDAAGARADFGRADATEPGRARLYAARAEFEAENGRWQASSRDCTRALTCSRRALDAHEAIETAPSPVELEAQLYYRRFEARARTGELTGALSDLARAHALDPKYSWPRGTLLERLDRDVRSHPRAGALLAWRARARLDASDFTGAETDAARALTLGGSPTWTVCWRAEALLRLGRDKEALAHARRARALDGSYPKVHGLLAELALRQGRFMAAVADARKAIDLYHSASWAYAFLGEALAGLGRFDEARVALDQALSWDPDAGKPSLLRALCRVNLGETVGVSADLAQARRRGLPREQIEWVRGQARALRAVTA